jgi:RNA polymerase sigma-70 factor (ECF subfamily)
MTSTCRACYIQRRIGDRTVTEDLTALTFERALVAVRGASFRNESFGGWLYRVAGNAIVDHVRRARRSTPLGAVDRPGGAGGRGSSDRTADHEADVGDERALAAFAAAIERDALRRALLALPEAHRRVLVLRFLDDLDPDEACAVLGCSRGTLAVRTHRALRALRGAMDKAAIDAA